ncbi:aspartate kinase [Mucilaginibacter auburnensis]|uniref:Aspartokinase n=1 Tax=Mucilaginibacter auburnensis TaxID=1457233 RepID=A0A2H9VVA2_9SPHI|nr:aspartate kinase [Mucilaginibacter auburnensis]PJJ84748.1 aspartate kinase [Mucilaginibacter auburnensis]
MLVFKFGGASVKDADGIINLARVVDGYKQQQLLIVVSAMGKTTNALEALTRAYVDGTQNMHALFEDIKQYHYNIMSELFEASHQVFDDVANTFVEIDWMIEEEPHDDYDFIYDQIVSIGELVSTRIVSAFLNLKELKNQWADARGLVHTDNTYREGKVIWDKTRESISKSIPQLLDKGFVVTQGFLGGTSENFTTTLGREGSDYTASIFASCLHAESVTIWKDVPGVLNADPKHFADTVKFDELSYNEAIEMTFYGATVIHPKTIKPLQNVNIPLLVKPFTDPDATGTIIAENIIPVFKKPVIILKQQQTLVSISAKDYSFIGENHLSDIFGRFAANQIKINTMQNSALSFSACVDHKEEWFDRLIAALSYNYRVRYNTGLSLLTVRHYGENTLKELTSGKTVLLEQFSRNTAQVVYK